MNSSRNVRKISGSISSVRRGQYSESEWNGCHTKWITVPRDSRPGLDNILTRLENVFALHNEPEARFLATGSIAIRKSSYNAKYFHQDEDS